MPLKSVYQLIQPKTYHVLGHVDNYFAHEHYKSSRDYHFVIHFGFITL